MHSLKEIEANLSGGSGPLQDLDPRAKLLVFLAFSAVAATSSSFDTLFAIVPYIALLLFALGEKLKHALRAGAFVNTFLIVIAATSALTYPSGGCYQIGSFCISKEGLEFAARLFLKSNEILLLMVLLVSTTPVFLLANALHHLRAPSKMVLLLFFSYRYLHVVEDELKKLTKAAKARGFSPGTNAATYRAYGYILGSLFVKSYLRARQIHKAMLCRGFNGVFHVEKPLHFRKRDWAFLAASLLYLSLVLLQSSTNLPFL